MPFSVATSSVCLGFREFGLYYFVVMLTLCSEIAVPNYHQVQEHAASWCADKGYGSSMDVEYQLVLSLHFRSAVCLRLPSWKRQW